MKAAINIEFLISVFLFLSVIVSTTIVVERELFPLEERSLLEDLKARSHYISSMLLFDNGFPENWNSSNVKRLGLSSGENYILNMSKINELNKTCSTSYKTFKGLLSVREDVELGIRYLDGESLLNCNAPEGNVRLFTERSCIINGRIAIMNVTVIR
ncbi:MAG: hypothetical protein V1900_02500 [Candidatus Aenigmatarchaeota archaeon]